MPHLFAGNCSQLFQAHGQDWLIIAQPGAGNTIIEDLQHTPFLGDPKAAQQYLNLWRATTRARPYYGTGNMTGANLCALFDSEAYHKHHFAFINDNREPCALSLMYHKDNPEQWYYGIIKNTHLIPKHRQVIVLSSENLKCVASQQGDKESLLKPFIDFSNSSLLKSLLNNAFTAAHPNFARIKLLTRFMHMNDQVIDDPIDFAKINLQALFGSNAALDLILKYQIPLSLSSLINCLEVNSVLSKELQAIALQEDERLNANLVKLTISLYEKKVLDEHRELLKKHALLQEFGVLLANKSQIALFPILVKREYDNALIKLILLEECYCEPLNIVADLGLLQNIPGYFKRPEKLALLKKLHGLEQMDVKKLGLVFWAKGEFSEEEFNNLLTVTKKYPLLATTLLALDKTHTCSIEKLKKLVNIPQKHLQKSILYHYDQEFTEYKLDRRSVKQFDITELEHLHQALSVLKSAKIKSTDYYLLALKKNHDGQLLRLFLPQLQENPKCNELIEILYTGITKGVVIQEKAIIAIKDPVLRASARALHERFICVKQIQDLMQDDDVKKRQITLAAEPNSVRAQRFRRVIFIVLKQCESVHEILLKSKTEYKKNGEWERADMEYRRKIYNIAYQGITNSGVDLEEQLVNAEKTILDIVDPETTTFVQDLLMVIANIIISVFTMGIANDIKYRSTGNYWFFNQSPPGEKIRALNREVMPLIKPTAPFFGG